MPGLVVKSMTTDMGIDGVRPQIRRWINDNRREHPPIFKRYMNVDNNNELFTEDLEMGGFSTFPRLDEGDYLNFVTASTGNKTRYQPDEFQAAFAITRKDRRFNRIGKVDRLTRMLNRAARASMERNAAQPFNLGFSASAPLSDGQPLFSTAHVNPAGTTVANRPAADVDLTLATFEAAWVAFMEMVGPDGNPIDIAPKFLIVHTSELPNALRIVRSPNYFSGGTPAAADTGVPNVAMQETAITVVSNPYLTDRDAWFLLAPAGEHELWVVSNQPLEDYSFEDQHTRDFVFSLSYAMVTGASSFVGAWGTIGA